MSRYHGTMRVSTYYSGDGLRPSAGEQRSERQDHGDHPERHAAVRQGAGGLVHRRGPHRSVVPAVAPARAGLRQRRSPSSPEPGRNGTRIRWANAVRPCRRRTVPPLGGPVDRSAPATGLVRTRREALARRGPQTAMYTSPFRKHGRQARRMDGARSPTINTARERREGQGQMQKRKLGKSRPRSLRHRAGLHGDEPVLRPADGDGRTRSG